MGHYFSPRENPDRWHDAKAQQDALEAFEAGNMEELERIFREARGLSIHRIMKEVIEQYL